MPRFSTNETRRLYHVLEDEVNWILTATTYTIQTQIILIERNVLDDGISKTGLLSQIFLCILVA
jgi:hypothetical protein